MNITVIVILYTERQFWREQEIRGFTNAPCCYGHSMVAERSGDELIVFGGLQPLNSETVSSNKQEQHLQHNNFFKAFLLSGYYANRQQNATEFPPPPFTHYNPTESQRFWTHRGKTTNALLSINVSNLTKHNKTTFYLYGKRMFSFLVLPA